MKNKTILLVTLFFCLSSIFFSQSNDIQIEFNSPFLDTIADNKISFSFKVTNNGPLSLRSIDTMDIWITVNDSIYNLRGSKNRFSSFSLNGNLPPTQNVISQIVTIPLDSISQVNSINKICLFTKYKDSVITDTNTTNNKDCYYLINATYLKKVKFEEVFTLINYPQSIGIFSTTNTQFNYIIINLQGKLMTRGTFFNSQTLSTESLPNGIYTLTIENQNQRFTKKFTVQN